MPSKHPLPEPLQMQRSKINFRSVPQNRANKEESFSVCVSERRQSFVAGSAFHLIPTATCRFHCAARYFKLRSQMLKLDPMIATGMEFDEFPLWVPGG